MTISISRSTWIITASAVSAVDRLSAVNDTTMQFVTEAVFILIITASAVSAVDRLNAVQEEYLDYHRFSR